MCNRIFHDFYATFSIILNNITSYIWLAMLSKKNDSIVGALLNFISPNERHWAGLIIVTYDLDTVLMWFCYIIIKDFRFVILNLNTNTTNLDLILHDISMYVTRCYNGWAAAESNLIALDLGSWGGSLNEYTCSLTTHYNIFWDNNIVFWFLVDHYSTGVEVSKRTLVYCYIAF